MVAPPPRPNPYFQPPAPLFSGFTAVTVYKSINLPQSVQRHSVPNRICNYLKIRQLRVFACFLRINDIPGALIINFLFCICDLHLPKSTLQLLLFFLRENYAKLLRVVQWINYV
nr:MAG TPA: hypothetical protein [Bacteriophage sp.]